MVLVFHLLHEEDTLPEDPSFSQEEFEAATPEYLKTLQDHKVTIYVDLQDTSKCGTWKSKLRFHEIIIEGSVSDKQLAELGQHYRLGMIEHNLSTGEYCEYWIPQ